MGSESDRRRQAPPRWLTWLGSHELATLITPAAIAGGVFGFLELAEEVASGSTLAFDRAVLLSMRTPADPTDPLGPPWVEEMVRDFTALGGVGVLTLLTLTVAAFLALEGKRRMMSMVIIAAGGGLVMSLFLKGTYDRPRPDLVPHRSFVQSASFPSGHSMMSAITYLTLGALLARSHRGRAMKAFLLLVAFLLTGLVGASRVYLGVHWPTDVLAGWTAGAVWALAAWVLTRWMQLHGQVERDTAAVPPETS